MTADFEVAFGNGHAGAGLRFDRSPAGGARISPWPAVVAIVLTLPFTLALVLNALGVLPSSGAAQAATRLLPYGPPLALLVLAATRVRVRTARSGGRITAGLSARLLRWEVAVGLLALLVAGVFFGHLAADALACANGVVHAC